MRRLFKTTAGELFLGKCEEVLKPINRRIAGKVQLILTSPPFPLKRKKRYGNFTGTTYIEWLSKLAPTFAELLTDDGSIVLELGNAWEPKQPVQSLLPLKSLLAFVENKNANLKLCQEFICFNPARLPSPAQWVTIERIRVKDSFSDKQKGLFAAVSEGEDIQFYREQRRYLRVITDAASTYHNAVDPTQSRINFIVIGGGVIARGSTPLEAGRLRLIAEGSASANIGDSGSVRVELSRPGAPTLFDERPFKIVDVPPARPAPQRATLPPFRVQPVRGPADDHWIDLAWTDDVNEVASSAEIEEGTLVIYYSTVFPKYARHRQTLEQRDLSKANSYTKRYEIWLAVHSLMLQEQQSKSRGETQTSSLDEDDEISETRERQERVRVATLSALFAAREVQITDEPGENSD